MRLTREQYRRGRLIQYENYEDIPLFGQTADMLRNMVCATSKHDVYVMSNDSIMHWSSVSQNLTEILNFSGHVAPTEKHDGSLLEGFTQTDISTLAINDDFLVAEGSEGELVCKKLYQQGVCFYTRVINEDNALTTAIEIYDTLSGGKHFLTSNNDCGMREYDMDGFQLVKNFRFPWPVNVSFLIWIRWA
ncbi:putative WD40-repeat-containing domain superfamily [Helianthus annuus]|nr:putative WD40-repeat-containing domain superfamily [Helianthus annuus]